MKLRIAPLLAAAALTACVDVEDPALGSGEQAIEDGVPAFDWQVRRAVKPVPCTATLVGSRYVLTALHCVWGGADESTAVRFYETSEHTGTVRIGIDHVHIPIGTDRVSDRYDVQGRNADVALLELASDAPSTSRVATLAWRYPGAGVSGHKVGAGGHDDQPNPDGALRVRVDRTYDGDDLDGEFRTEQDQLNGNDSGGPFYVDTRVVGVARAHSTRAYYTSVPIHVPWMLGIMNWTWLGSTPVAYVRNGTVREMFHAPEKVCQYACTKGGADAYNWAANPGFCVLVDDVTSTVPSSVYRSALR